MDKHLQLINSEFIVYNLLFQLNEVIEYITPPQRHMAADKGTKKSRGKGGKRRRKIKLSLRSRSLKKEQSHVDSIGWSKVQEQRSEDTGPKEPEVIQHQCSYCGAMNRIPKPKRAKYQVECANPDCGHVDSIE